MGLYWDNGKENGNYYNIGVILRSWSRAIEKASVHLWREQWHAFVGNTVSASVGGHGVSACV